MIKQYTKDWLTHRSTLYILLEDNEIIGSVEVEHGNDYNRFHSFYIQDDKRHQGYGDMVLKHVLNDIKDIISLTVDKDNENAIRLYKKHGFDFIYGFEVDNENLIWMENK